MTLVQPERGPREDARGAVLTDVHELPRVVLDADDLDNLELALSEALPGGPALVATTAALAGAQRVLLTDAENTPLALFDAAGESESGALPTGSLPTGTLRPGAVHPLRPLPARTGAAYDPDLRARPAEFARPRGGRALGREPADPAPVVAIVFTDLPTRADLARARQRIESVDPRAVLWVAAVSRRAGSRAPRSRTADADAVTRAVMAAKPAGAVGIVVPQAHPHAPSLRPLLGDAGVTAGAEGATGSAGTAASLQASICASYGARESIDVVGERTESELEDLRIVGSADRRALDALFPAASAREFARQAERTTAGAGGAVILFTGLSGSGKSTIAAALAARLETDAPQAVTVLDGDEVRQMLSSELGFDRASRELNLRRIGYVAGLISRSGGIAIAAPIAPFDASRQEIRRLATQHGAFLLVHVATPLAVCEARDRKGLYARARAGLVEEFTGISSPYEPPADADVVIDATDTPIDECVDAVIAALDARLSGARP
jgi:sulfate adenylyltransferase